MRKGGTLGDYFIDNSLGIEENPSFCSNAQRRHFTVPCLFHELDKLAGGLITIIIRKHTHGTMFPLFRA